MRITLFDDEKKRLPRNPASRGDASLGVQRLNHHLDLSLLDDKQVPFTKHRINRINNLVETAGGSPFLREASNRQVAAPSVFDDRHDFDGKGDFFQIEVCRSWY